MIDFILITAGILLICFGIFANVVMIREIFKKIKEIKKIRKELKALINKED